MIFFSVPGRLVFLLLMVLWGPKQKSHSHNQKTFILMMFQGISIWSLPDQNCCTIRSIYPSVHQGGPCGGEIIPQDHQQRNDSHSVIQLEFSPAWVHLHFEFVFLIVQLVLGLLQICCDVVEGKGWLGCEVVLDNFRSSSQIEVPVQNGE